MFNKPSLSPKAGEPQAVRSGRASGPVPGSGSGDNLSTQRDTLVSSASSFGGSNAAMVSSRREEAGKANESRLIVGPSVKLKGAEILDCDTLVVEGRVEAMMDSRVLRIAEQGAYSGTVSIDVAEIHGQFDGELTARSQLIIHTTGKVSGKIRYGKIFIEEGGQISGDIQALGTGSTDSNRRASAAPGSAESKLATTDV